MDWDALGLSLRLAGSTVLIHALIGLPLAYWLATSRWRGRLVVDALIALPLILPPTVLGFYFLVAMGPSSLFGQTYERLTGRLLPFSFQGLLVASVLYSLPFAVRPFMAGFAAVDRKLIEASWCLGVSRPATFRRITLPLAWPGIVTGLVLSFAHTLGEFGVVMMVGGNIPRETRTLSIAIYDDVQAFDYARAGQTSLFLLAVAFVALIATYSLQRRAWL